MLAQVDVRVYWDFIAPGLREIKEEANPEWRPEDIYGALVNNIAELYVDIEQEPCESFIILQEKPSVFQPTKSLLIWVAYDKRGEAADKYMDYIEDMARERGCNRKRSFLPRSAICCFLYHKSRRIGKDTIVQSRA